MAVVVVVVLVVVGGNCGDKDGASRSSSLTGGKRGEVDCGNRGEGG